MIKVDENDPVGELEPSFPYREVNIRRNVDMKEFYDLETEIGRGKFGTVYRCREKSTGLTLAAKFVGIAKRQERRNVEKEVEIMRALQHPRLIQLYDALESSNVMCVVLELIEGGELFERVIDDDFILTEKSCSVFMRQICEGVAFIHSKNILHLDLKPENIMCLTRTGNRIKIIDFGLARQFDPEKKLQVLFGTPEFVAPEVVNFDAIGYGTDMWSVGVICYVLLSGLSPFMGETDVETMANVTIAQYDFDDVAFDDISADAKDFIKSLLLKDKERRLTASECLSHKWLRRKPLARPTDLDTTKDNLKSVVERWNGQPTSPTVVIVVPPDEPPLPSPVVAAVSIPENKISTKTKEEKPKKTPSTKVKSSEEKSTVKQKTLPKAEKNSDATESPVKGKGLEHNQTSPNIPAKLTEQAIHTTFNPNRSDVKVEENKTPKFTLKPSPSVPNVASTKLQSAKPELNISKILTQSVKPKIAGIVLGQSIPPATQPVENSTTTPHGPKVITHKILIEGKTDRQDNTPNKGPVQKTTIPAPIPIIRGKTAEGDSNRRASDFSCFLHDTESPRSANLADEIKNLSARLLHMSAQHKSLDETQVSGNMFNDPIRQFLANHGVTTRRPKHRLTNLNRDVPIGSPPPPSNFTYLVSQCPPSSSRLPWVKQYSPEIHSAPQSPRISPSRFNEGPCKDVVLRLFDKLDDTSTSVSSSSSIDSLVNYFKTANEAQKKATPAK